jgi:hypothetical protein
MSSRISHTVPERVMVLGLALALLAPAAGRAPAGEPSGAESPPWKSLPAAEPTGEKEHTGSYTVKEPPGPAWKAPPFIYREKTATGRKHARVAVVIYDPVLESEGGKRLTEFLKANDPIEYSRILANVIREASWGYINYEIVDFITVNAFPQKVDGFRYTDRTFLEARKAQKWQPATMSYRRMLEETKLLDRFKNEG